MENPGSIRTGKKQMLKGGISDPRNKAIMKMLNLIGIGERAGSGVPDIYGVWEQQGWKEPEVLEQYGPDRTILKLSFVEKVAIKGRSEQPIKKKTEKNLETILEYMAADTEYKTLEIADILDVKISRARKLMSLLVQQGKIEALGGNRDRRYVKRLK